LARRIVLPLLLLIGALFVLLGAAAVWIADRRVQQELEQKADRVAETLDALPQARPEILAAVARLVGVELVVDGVGTRPEWSAEEVERVAPPEARLGGASYEVLERRYGRPERRLLVLAAADELAGRRRDVLEPIAVAGALCLLVSLGLGLWAARAIARPVRDLALSVRGFGEGTWDGRVGVRGPGEIGELQDAFARMVDALKEQERKLREQERFAALGRLAGGIAHELRNPLTAIRMAVETATRGGEADREDARRVALQEIDRLDRTLRELLDFVRPRRPVLADLDAAALLREVAALLEPQCAHLRVRLEVDAPEGLALRGDRDRLKQALLNLVLNGAQAQPRGGVVRLRARPGRLEVEDEGAGIPAEVRESLLQPFVTTKEAGIGLGLAVVAQVAAEHGAELDFRTGERGTTFTLRFPS